MTNQRGNITFLLGKMLRFGTESILSGIQVLYISVFIILLIFLVFSSLLASVDTYSDPVIPTFYALIIGAFSISFFAITKPLGKHLDSFNRQVIFTLVSYLYLFIIIAPSNISKLYRVMSSKLRAL